MKIIYWRRIIQIVFLITLIYGGFLVTQTFNIPPKTLSRGTEYDRNLIDASLPIRTCRYIEPKPTLFESCGLRYLFSRPLYLNFWIPVVFFIFLIILLCFIFGRFMCGWMCPLGFVEDSMNYLRKKAGIRRTIVPDNIKKILKYWRYSFLLFLFFISLAILAPFLEGIYMNKNFSDVACQVCPAKMIVPLFWLAKPLFPPFLTIPTSIFSILSFIFLGVFITGLFITRFWCTICPNGSFISLFNKGGLVIKEKDVQKCTKCGICRRVCPFTNDDIFKEKKKSVVNHKNCIMCFNCTDKCPEDGCLKVKFLGLTIFKSKFKNK